MAYIGKKPSDVFPTSFTVTNGTVEGAFTSQGIDDNADATAITITSDENVGVGTTSPTNFGGTNLHVNHATTYASALWTSNARSMQVLCSDANSVQSMGTRSNHPLDITTNDNAKIKITANGEVTMPSQPAFHAKNDGSNSNLSINNTHVIVFNSERFDQNSDYNTSTSTFTAPVTGKYQLSVNLYLQHVDDGASYIQFEITTSNKIYYYALAPNGFDADPTYFPFTTSVLADMDASDTAQVKVYQSGGSAVLDLDGHSNFSGYLVC